MQKILSTRLIHLLAVFTCILWASAFLAGKYALQFLPPLRLAGLRLFLASGILLTFLHKNPLLGLQGNYRWIALLSLVQTIIVFSAFNYGLNLVPGSFGAIIIGSSPAVSSIMAVLFISEEQMTIRKILGLVIGLVGISILAFSRQPWTAAGKLELVGAGLLMICNLGTALGSVILKKKMSDLPIVSVNIVQLFLGGIVVMLLSFVFEPLAEFKFDVMLAGSVIYLAFVTATAVSLWMIIISQGIVRISIISMWKFLIPSLGAVLSWIFVVDDNPTRFMVFGLVTIVLAILLTVSGSQTEGSHSQKQWKHGILPLIGEEKV